MQERLTYQEIRSWVLGCFYQFYRGKVISHGNWVQDELEISFAYEQYYNSFELPLEQLMLEVLAMIMLAGRFSDTIQFHQKNVDNILKNNSLEDMLKDVSLEESEEFIQDMEILKLIDANQAKKLMHLDEN
jgi:uncharacterized Fe-S cluster-containing MiaB family protein